MIAKSKRFRVAISFAGEKRQYVAQIASILAARFGENAVLYDRYHEAELARRNLAFYLSDLYHNEADLIVVVISPDYQLKEWCGLEWDAIFAVLKERRNEDVMLLRFNHASLQGLFLTAGFVELDEKTPQEAAALIFQRLALNDARTLGRDSIDVQVPPPPARSPRHFQAAPSYPAHTAAASLTTARDRHLFGPGRKRILSLDGGGVRSMLSVGILEHLERTIEEIEGRPVRLGEWFDLIGGTSTGSIIATLLALGYRVHEVRDLYERFAPQVFKRPSRLMGWQAKFDERNFKRECERLLGTRRLESEDLLTGLCMVLERLDTGSSWILINNPRSAFWNDPRDRSFAGNRHMLLANLVRASTASPHFFGPELIPIVEGGEPGLFIDGGLTPHNSPALMMVLAAIFPAVGLNWKTGPDDLLVVSVGTGTFRPKVSAAEAMSSGAFRLAVKFLSAIISENQNLILTLMTYFGESPVSWPINSEIGDLGPLSPPGGKLFRFLRYDARLDQTWLEQTLEERLPPDAIERLQKMDNPLNLPTLLRVGRGAGRRQVSADHLKGFETGAESPPPARRQRVQDDPGLLP